jgi:uncharacterized protein (DUF427 family)
MRVNLSPGPLHPITVEPSSASVTVTLHGRRIAASSETLTLHEANHAPVRYFPREHVEADVLVESDHATYCPFKGDAAYYHLRVEGETVENAVWTYPSPYDAVSPITGYLAFHPKAVDSVDVVEA